MAPARCSTCISTARDQRAHPIADAPPRHRWTNADDRACDFQPGNVRRAGWRRVMPAPLHDVGSVHTGGFDLNQDLAACWIRYGPSRGAHTFGAAGLGDFNRRHLGGTSCMNTFLAPAADLLRPPSASRPLRIGAVRRRRVVAREPSAQAIETGKQHTLVDVRLIQFVADFPLERRRHDDPATEIGMLLQPVVESRRRTRHQREQGELIEDALIDGRRFEEHDKRLAAERVELAKGLERRQHLNGERIGSLLLQEMLQEGGQSPLALTKLTHQTIPSLSNSEVFSVAKWSATSGEYVQSRRRVGSPRCCPIASQSQIESAVFAWPCPYSRSSAAARPRACRYLLRAGQPQQRTGKRVRFAIESAKRER